MTLFNIYFIVQCFVNNNITVSDPENLIQTLKTIEQKKKELRNSEIRTRNQSFHVGDVFLTLKLPPKFQLFIDSLPVFFQAMVFYFYLTYDFGFLFVLSSLFKK